MGVSTRAFRNISRRKIRALLVVIALGFSLAIMSAIPSGIMANQIASQNLAENLGSLITQTQATINQSLTQIDCSLSQGLSGFGFRPDSGFGQGSRPGYSIGANNMNASLYSDISSITGVAAVVPILQVTEGTTEEISRFGRTFTILRPQYVIEGILLDASLIANYPLLPTNIVSGTNLLGGETGLVLLSENNSAYFNTGVGGAVTIPAGSQYTFNVVGVYKSSSSGTSTFGTSALTLFMSLSDAQIITGNVGNITSLVVFANSSSYTTQVANAISSLHPELTVTTAQDRLSQLQSMQEQYSTALQNAQASLSQTQSTAIMEIGVAVAATSLIVLVVMLYAVRERTKEIGILKAIGFSNRNIMSQFIIEGVLLSLIAGVVGVMIGAVGAPYITSFLLPSISQSGLGGFGGNPFGQTSLSQPVTTISPEILLLTFGAAVLLGALGSLYPAWRASKTSPMEALKYE